MLMLHIGCGEVYFHGWVNIDLESEKADLKHDIREPLPYQDSSVDVVYSEHFVEHLTAEKGVQFFKDVFRVLKKDGVMRIAMPDLDYVVFKYLFGWKSQDWIKEFGYSYMENKAEMMNTMFRDWGHKWLYNYEELKRRLLQAGFIKIKKVKFCKSRFLQLRNRETRKDSKLIVEVVK